MKNKLLFLIALFFPVQVMAEPLLYDVLKDQAETGTLAKEYTGEHQDTVDGTGNQKIYHWFADTRENGLLINEKRSVIFGGFCWEILRTTDSGGVRLLYDGVPKDGTCDRSRTPATNTRYDSDRTMSENYEFYVADGFIYYEAEGNYILDETKEIVSTATLNPDDIIGKYSQFNTNNQKVSSLYKITNYDSNTRTIYYDDLDVTPQFLIGYAPYSTLENHSSIGSIGYMHNFILNINTYLYPNNNWGSLNQPSEPVEQSIYNVISNSTTDPFTFDTSTKKWVGRHNRTSTGYEDTTITFKVTTAGNYVMRYNTTTREGTTKIYKNDELLTQSSNSVDSSIILENVTTDDVFKVYYQTYVTNSNKKPLYFSMENPTGEITDTRILLGNSVTYENGMYTLVDTIRSDGNASHYNNHYTCLNTTGTCEEVTYLASKIYTGYSYFILKDGQTIESILNDMLYADDVNKYDSPMKEMVDAWFEENLIDYLPYLEDTVFCNNRVIPKLEQTYFNPNGGYNSVSFQGNVNNSEEVLATYATLKCSLETDRFAVGNTKAQLKYPVAIPSLAEMFILDNSNYNYSTSIVKAKNADYRLMTAVDYGMVHYDWIVQPSGTLYGVYDTNNEGIRPEISLKAGIEYISGDGSKANPYVIREYQSNKATIVNDGAKGNVTLDALDPNSILEETPVIITIDPIEGFVLGEIKIIDANNKEVPVIALDTPNQYQFTMPRTDVTIITVYKAPELPTDSINPETRDYIFTIIIILSLSLSSLVFFKHKQKDII